MKKLITMIGAAAIGMAMTPSKSFAMNEPDNYLLFVESNGSQWIDTGIEGKAGVKSDIDIDWISGVAALGVYKNYNFLLLQIHSSKIGGQVSKSAGTQWTPTGASGNSGRHHIVSDAVAGGNFSITLDGTTFTSENTIAANFTTVSNIYVFAANQADGGAWGHVKAKLYGLKLYEGNTLVRDFVPGEKDGVAGLYDKKNDVWYVSQSGTPLVAGPVLATPANDCTFVDYLESTGSEYIDTGVFGRAGTKAEIDIDWVSGDSPLGVLHGGNLLFLQRDSSIIAGQGLSSGWAKTDVLLDSGRHFIVSEIPVSGKMTIAVDGGEASSSENDVSSYNTKSNIYVFAANDATGDVWGSSIARVYGLRLWQLDANGEYRLVRNFRPCVQGGVAGMYDAETGGFFPPLSGTLTAGPVVDRGKPDAFVEYVESNGQQWIDTGVIGRAGVKAEIDFTFKQSQGVLGTYVASKKHCMLIQTGSKLSGQAEQSGSIDTGIAPTSNDGRHFVVSEVVRDGAMTMTIDGGEEKKSGTAVAANFTTGINMGIFAHLKANGAAPYSPASMKLYSLKLWLTDANGVCRLQRDYRPCVKDSKAGLYDTISGVIFYPTNATPLTASGTQLPIALWRNHTGDGSFDNPENWGGVANAATNIVYVRCDNAITVAGDHAFDKLAIEGFGAIRFSGAGTISIGESLTSYADLTVGNMVLNGTCATNLTVAGSISGHGTVQSLAFGEGATFKPDGTGYLTITDSLSGTVTVDAGDLLLENRRIPLFKTGTSAALPSAESIQFVGGKQPKGWTLNSAHEGYGYDICKKGFMIFIM